MKLFVDYTNWKNIRQWREIQPIEGTPYLGWYTDGDGTNELTYIMKVCMVDRNNAPRTLRLDHIHGFKVEP